MMSSRPLILTPCSAEKFGDEEISATQLPLGPQSSVAQAWLKLLAQPWLRTYKPAQVYRGRSVRIALQVGTAIGADVHIVSAGLGYITGETSIPVYDLTVSRSGSGSVLNRITTRFEANTWWKTITNGRFSSRPDRELCMRPSVLVSLPASYAPLISRTLEAYLEDGCGSLRIVGHTLLRDVLSPQLRPFALLYDERLNSLGISGAMCDFAQRSLKHYTSVILPMGLNDIGREAAAVAGILQKGTFMPRATNRRATDEELITIIQRLSSTREMPRSRMLNHLRRVEGIACEQSRFSELWQRTFRKGPLK